MLSQRMISTLLLVWPTRSVTSFIVRTASIHTTTGYISTGSRKILPNVNRNSIDTTDQCIRGAKSVSFVCRSSSSLTATKDIDYSSLVPDDLPRREDVLVGLDAVRKACLITNSLQPDYPLDLEKKSDELGIMKEDLSPVTVGDFAAQAVVLNRIFEAYEEDSFVAEESSKSLRSDSVLTQGVLNAIRSEVSWTEDELYSAIDLGKKYEHQSADRTWVLDPVDGTRGFLRGRLNHGQYCVALCLLDKGIPVIGILGCPNLVSSEGDDYDDMAAPRGCIFFASKSGGSYQVPLFPTNDAPYCSKLDVTPNDGKSVLVGDARFCIGVESYGNFGGKQSKISSIIHGEHALNKSGDIVKARRMDSQVKYGVIARGGAEVFLRFTKDGYNEFIWDHAAGGVVIIEAGGQVSDLNGNELDYSQRIGDKLPSSVEGIIATNGGVFHESILDAHREITSTNSKEDVII
mmetsp:Transcript_8148/g.10457  ORF Transcript_8148/g.10457 Transcript_8148/m.10457 type:complete len:461 (-) Transcript_8148:1745-3127(-)